RFLFSTRRRHTRFSRDWSSDVCSSDLSRSELLDEPEPVPNASLVTTPVVEHGLIVERPVLVTPENPRGVRFVAGVGLADLLSLRSEERRVGKKSQIPLTKWLVTECRHR